MIYYTFFFFFLHVHTRGGREIRTSNLRFIRHGLSRLRYLLRTLLSYYTFSL
jgi:hypothetical protein